jgi:hypothetical protein
MKVAISTDGDYVSAHFGRCPAFTLVDIDGNMVLGRERVENPGHEPAFLPGFLAEKGVSSYAGPGREEDMGWKKANAITPAPNTMSRNVRLPTSESTNLV